jgi:hypothetical protein
MSENKQARLVKKPDKNNRGFPSFITQVDHQYQYINQSRSTYVQNDYLQQPEINLAFWELNDDFVTTFDSLQNGDRENVEQSTISSDIVELGACQNFQQTKQLVNFVNQSHLRPLDPLRPQESLSLASTFDTENMRYNKQATAVNKAIDTDNHTRPKTTTCTRIAFDNESVTAVENLLLQSVNDASPPPGATVNTSTVVVKTPPPPLSPPTQPVLHSNHCSPLNVDDTATRDTSTREEVEEPSKRNFAMPTPLRTRSSRKNMETMRQSYREGMTSDDENGK